MDRPDTAPHALDPDACYQALRSRDARFDGQFFTAVTSTGIYCRPVCRVRVPQRRHCRFFRHAAAAEAAGFRPCLRCRPELAPAHRHWSGQDATGLLVAEACSWIDRQVGAGAQAVTVVALAARLGVGERHLRRVFQARLGVAPMRYLQTRRLLNAKQLLTDTRLPVARVAEASGFGSLRRFHDAFRQAYGMNPGRLRSRAIGHHPPADGDLLIELGWRPPFAVPALLAFFARRALPGVEVVDPDSLQLARTLVTPAGTPGWIRARFEPERHRVRVRIAGALAAQLPWLSTRIRAWLDLDADPSAIDAVLGEDFPGHAGLRVPGSLDGFELAVRAVVGQQVTVAAARTLLSRLVAALGEPLETPLPGLERLFPTPTALREASEDRLGSLGIVRQRQAAIRALADAALAGRLQLEPGGGVAGTIDALKALPGIGDWTAQYIAMRALRWPDAFPAGDIALRKALGGVTARTAEQLSQRWRPWRSYAVLHTWQGHFHPSEDQA